MANIEIKCNDGDYESRAYDFYIAEDLYLFFKFESPKSNCEIGIAYDQFVDGGDWYVEDGALGGCDREIVDGIVWNEIYKADEFNRLLDTIDRAVKKFNRED